LTFSELRRSRCEEENRHTLNELCDVLLLLQCFTFSNQIHLVLQDQDIPQLHDFNGGQVFRRLRLGTGFVSGDQKECGVHDGGTRQHGSHQNIVSGTIDERDVSVSTR
jgi:hypothetical protein